MRSVLLASLCMCVLASPVLAQQVEQNSARLLAGDPVTSLSPTDPDFIGLDATPFGVDLSGIVILGDAASARSSANVDGVDIRSDSAGLGNPALVAVLAPYIGQPLSQRLIGEVRAAITEFMRDANRPLVAVIVPPQEVTSGTVQFVVIPFVVGDVRIERVETGVVETTDERILDAIRIERGDEVAADILIEDLAVLNANPFRQVGVVFQPGGETGETDLILRVSDQKPWQVFAGYNNAGTQATGLNRLFVGGIWANTAGNDEQLSYQFTVSPRTLVSAGGLFDFGQDKAFMSHSAAALVPLPWRHNLILRADYLHARADQAGPFVQDTQTGQINLEYGLPLVRGPNGVELFGGLDAKFQRTQLEFAGIPLGPNYVDIFQGFAGVRGQFSLGPTTNEFLLKGVFSPGGITANNSDAAFAAASGNPGASATYAYVQASFGNVTQLPLDFSFQLDASGQLATTALPALEQLGIGGMGTVRGYETNEVAGDHGAYIQAELHLPPFSLLQDLGGAELGILDQQDVYAFLDYGVAHDIATGTTTQLLSAGAGVNVAINQNVNATLAWGHAFLAGPTTSAGSDRFHVSITGTY